MSLLLLLKPHFHSHHIAAVASAPVSRGRLRREEEDEKEELPEINKQAINNQVIAYFFFDDL